MPAGTFLLEFGEVEEDGSLIFSRVLADLSHQVGSVAVVDTHAAFYRKKGMYSLIR